MNHVLIDFYDPNLEADFTRRDDTIQIRMNYIDSSLIYIENWSNLIDNWSIYFEIVIFSIYIVVFDINRRFPLNARLFRLNNRHLVD